MTLREFEKSHNNIINRGYNVCSSIQMHSLCPTITKNNVITLQSKYKQYKNIVDSLYKKVQKHYSETRNELKQVLKTYHKTSTKIIQTVGDIKTCYENIGSILVQSYLIILMYSSSGEIGKQYIISYMTLYKNQINAIENRAKGLALQLISIINNYNIFFKEVIY